ncbi:hypothetical protein KA005_51410 [bacterium]|nr:hypothetical protein [bacterium]
MAINEELWIMVIIFMFTVVIGYIKKDAILHLISFVIGIALMIQFLGDNLYLGFAMAILSIYIAYYALWIEWPAREG